MFGESTLYEMGVNLYNVISWYRCCNMDLYIVSSLIILFNMFQLVWKIIMVKKYLFNVYTMKNRHNGH